MSKSDSIAHWLMHQGYSRLIWHCVRCVKSGYVSIALNRLNLMLRLVVSRGVCFVIRDLSRVCAPCGFRCWRIWYVNACSWLETRHPVTIRCRAIYLLFFVVSLLALEENEVRTHRLTTLAGALICFILLFGLTDVFVIFTQNLYLLLAITAIAASWQKTYDPASRQAQNRSVRT